MGSGILQTRWTRIAMGVLIALMVLAAGCSDKVGTSPTDSPAPGPYTIVTTTGMITDLATQIAGEQAKVVGLMGTGIDPHMYAPTRSDIGILIGADVVFYNGLLLEGKLTDALIRVGQSGTIVRAVTEGIDPSFLLSPEEFEGHHDPHLWMDPSAWTKAAQVIRDVLIDFDPSGEEHYRTNTETLVAQIMALDAYAERVLATVPENERILVTAHDAFNYFGRRYGYQVVGIQGISTESEAGVRDIERIVDLLVTQKIKAVFVETTVSERNIRALVAGAKAQNHMVVIGGNLFSDAMGHEHTYKGTYIGMIDHNITTIVRALGGQAPARGMNGQFATEESP